MQALSMGVHESQSLLWERMVALSLPFSRYLAPRLAAAFPQLPDLQASQASLSLQADHCAPKPGLPGCSS